MTSLNLTPGAIVKPKYGDTHFLVVSMPLVVRTLNQVKVVPIAENLKDLMCDKLPHIIVPSNLATKGVICLHHEEVAFCDDVHYVERINDKLLTYIMSQLRNK